MTALFEEKKKKVQEAVKKSFLFFFSKRNVLREFQYLAKLTVLVSKLLLEIWTGAESDMNVYERVQFDKRAFAYCELRFVLSASRRVRFRCDIYIYISVKWFRNSVQTFWHHCHCDGTRENLLVHIAINFCIL